MKEGSLEFRFVPHDVATAYTDEALRNGTVGFLDALEERCREYRAWNHIERKTVGPNWHQLTAYDNEPIIENGIWCRAGPQLTFDLIYGEGHTWVGAEHLLAVFKGEDSDEHISGHSPPFVRGKGKLRDPNLSLSALGRMFQSLDELGGLEADAIDGEAMPYFFLKCGGEKYRVHEALEQVGYKPSSFYLAERRRHIVVPKTSHTRLDEVA